MSFDMISAYLHTLSSSANKCVLFPTTQPLFLQARNELNFLVERKLFLKQLKREEFKKNYFS